MEKHHRLSAVGVEILPGAKESQFVVWHYAKNDVGAVLRGYAVIIQRGQSVVSTEGDNTRGAGL